jgi:biotin carboxylase
MRIAEACQGLTQFAFLVHGGDQRVAPVVPVLRELAPVVTHDGDLPGVLRDITPLKPRGVVAFADSTLQLAAAIAEAFGLPHNSRQACDLLRSKLRQRQCLNAHDVGAVRTFGFFLDRPESVPAEARFPAIIKPEEGAASKDTVLVGSRGEFTARLSGLAAGPYVVEEYIRGAPIYGADWLADYLSVESAVSGGRIAHLGMTARLPLVEPVREGGAVFSAVPDEKTAAAITGLAERAIGAVGITTGLVHTEIKMTPDGPQVIEVNGRLGGSMERLIPRAMGTDPVRLAVEIALGASLPRDFGAPDRLVMVVYVQPPVNATAVETMPSPAQLRGLPGVFGMDRILRDGQPVDWRNGTLGRICEVWIDAASLDELGERYRAVTAVLGDSIAWRRD